MSDDGVDDISRRVDNGSGGRGRMAALASMRLAASGGVGGRLVQRGVVWRDGGMAGRRGWRSEGSEG